jgi:hypothetical protein
MKNKSTGVQRQDSKHDKFERLESEAKRQGVTVPQLLERRREILAVRFAKIATGA